MNKLVGLAGTALTLTGLYLVLSKATGATLIFKELASGIVSVFRTLQGRP